MVSLVWGSLEGGYSPVYFCPLGQILLAIHGIRSWRSVHQFISLDAGPWGTPGMGMEVVHFLQPTPSSEESARAWSPCLDQSEKNGNSGWKWSWQGLGVMHGLNKGRGMAVSLSGPAALPMQRLLTALPPWGSLWGTAADWPLWTISYSLRLAEMVIHRWSPAEGSVQSPFLLPPPPLHPRSNECQDQ